MTVSRGGLEFEIRKRKKETIIHSVSVPKCLNSWTQLSYAKSIPVIFGIVLFPPIPLVQFVPIHPITLLQTEPSQAHLCVTWATVWTRNSLHSWNRLNIHKFKEYAIFIYLSFLKGYCSWQLCHPTSAAYPTTPLTCLIEIKIQWRSTNMNKNVECRSSSSLWLSRVFYSNQNYQKKPVLPISPRWQNLFLSLPVQFPSLKPSQPMC